MLTIFDIKTGYSFDYQSQQWRAVEKYFYKWDEDGTITTEFKIQSDKDTRYLEIDEYENIISVSQKIRYGDLSGESGSSTVNFNGTDYHLEKEHSGLYWEESSKWEKEAFNVWDYFDDTRKNWISVEEWDDEEFEVYVGSIIDPSEISNIQEGKPPAKFNMNPLVIIELLAVSGIFLFVFIFNFSKDSNTTNYKTAGTIIDNYKSSDKTVVLLNDMKYDESGSDKYTHQYKVIYKDQEAFKSEITDFKNVSPATFLYRHTHMGSDIAYKTQDKVNPLFRPPGYGIFVGDTTFGEWINGTNDTISGKNTNWKFKTQYASIDSFYNFNERPVNHTQWMTYQNLPNKNQAFHGNNNEYSTDAYLQTETGKKSNWALTPLAKREEAIRQAKIDKEKAIATQRQRTYRNSNRYSGSSSRRSSGGK